MTEGRDPTRRFGDRVADYVQARPSYPRQLVDLVSGCYELTPDRVIADIGSGTGKLAELFLEAGYRVIGVEPNGPMRRAAEELLAGYPRFRSIDGRAEATNLEDRSVDLVMVGQAFHWFEPAATHTELRRILGERPVVLLVWNNRRVEASAFMMAYEGLLREFGTDYAKVNHQRLDRRRIESFFEGRCAVERFDYRQSFDREALRARMRSSSYVPAPGRPGHRELLARLDREFDLHQRDGRVVFEYETRVYHGLLARTTNSLSDHSAR